MLISVHLPKTAGSSFLASIREHYGDTLYKDYGDRPINRRTLARNSHAAGAKLWHATSGSRFEGFDCIHGHFMPLKYTLLPPRKDLRFVTWLRDPVERLASHYHYWMRHYNPTDTGALHRRVVEEQWSLERFCLGPELQNTYCKFLWGFHLDRFDFVGVTEHYEEDLAYFSRNILGHDVASRRDNVNPERDQPAYITDDGFLQQVQQHHAKDMRLYQRALLMRQNRPW
jgi:hypothetical protein